MSMNMLLRSQHITNVGLCSWSWGTWKIFLWYAIINKLRSEGLAVLVVAPSGIDSLIRINPTPSVIMSMTYWRCQLGQLQEVGQRSLKKH